MFRKDPGIKRFRQSDFQGKLTRARKYQRKLEANTWQKLSIVGKFLILAFVLTGVYFFAISNFFLINSADLKETDITAEQVNDVLVKLSRKRLYYLIPSNHILVLNKSRLFSALQAELPEVKDITNVKRKFPNHLEFTAEKRSTQYIWKTGFNYYVIDQDGVVFRKIEQYAPELYAEKVITDKTGTQAIVGENLKIEPVLLFIKEIENNWGKYLDNTAVAEFFLPGKQGLDLILRTSSGFDIYFDLQQDPILQLGYIKLLFDQEISLSMQNNLKYIRILDKAYFCLKGAPCAVDTTTSTSTPETLD